MLEVRTSQYTYKGEDRLDITVKTGNKTFAPTWEMVVNFKKGSLTEEDYRQKYLELMRDSVKTNLKEWQSLLKKERITLVCFCRKDSFCHRKILAEILVKAGAKYSGEVSVN